MGLRQAGRPSLRTTYALSHEANANTGLTTEAAEEDDGMREGEVLERGTVTVTFAACPRYLLQAGLARRIRRPAQLCVCSRSRQQSQADNGLAWHGKGRAWHGLLHAAGSTASRVWQLSKYVVRSHVSVRHLSTRPQPSVVE